MQKRKALCVALAIPMALSTASLAVDEPSSGQMQGNVLKDEKVAAGTVRLSKLIGTGCFDPQGDNVGKITEVVIDREHDKILYLVLSQSKGLVELQEKLIALPFKALKFDSPAEGRVYVVLNKDVLEKSPGFDESKWPMQVNAEYYRALDAYYNTQLAAIIKEEVPTTQPAEAQKAAAQIPEPMGMDWSRRATRLTGRAVTSPAGENLGHVTDIVVDQKSGNICYAVLTDFNDHQQAVPISVFRIDPGDQTLILNTTRDQLEKTPSFDKNHWPTQPDPRWMIGEELLPISQ